ncbi:hypothetical protein [Conchiformibius kuhniae]|uniref:Secreted protein n=1 Tax=Conchiformibius kuhniae TaxID=211502 RepID=A0A8T9MV86_9NEIS|nr:hypothetical protein [Conchiformibius kuhniae]UOP04396.1 hypothetical protein LVJ77_08710 [Conchiformibius kuhniae]
MFSFMFSFARLCCLPLLLLPLAAAAGSVRPPQHYDCQAPDSRAKMRRSACTAYETVSSPMKRDNGEIWYQRSLHFTLADGRTYTVGAAYPAAAPHRKTLTLNGETAKRGKKGCLKTAAAAFCYRKARKPDF